MTNYTPGELQVKEDGRYLRLVNEKGGFVATMNDWLHGPEDAERLTHTWNCHDELLAALEIALDWLGDDRMLNVTTTAGEIRLGLARTKIQAAINKAKGLS